MILFIFVKHIFFYALFNFYGLIDKELISSLWDLNYLIYPSNSLILINIVVTFLIIYLLSKTLKGKAVWKYEFNSRKLSILKIIALSCILIQIIYVIFSSDSFTYRYSSQELSESGSLQLFLVLVRQINIPLILIIQACLFDKDKHKFPLLLTLVSFVLIGSVGLGSAYFFILYLLFIFSFNFKIDIKNNFKKLFKDFKLSKSLFILFVLSLTIYFSINQLAYIGNSRKSGINIEESVAMVNEQMDIILPIFIVRNNVDNATLLTHSLGNNEPACINNYNSLKETISLNFYRLNSLLNRSSISRNNDNEPKSISRMNVFAINNCDSSRVGPKEGTSIPFTAQLLRTIKESKGFFFIIYPIVWIFIIRVIWYIFGNYISNYYYCKNALCFFLIVLSGHLVQVGIDSIFLVVDESILAAIMFLIFRDSVRLPNENRP